MHHLTENDEMHENGMKLTNLYCHPINGDLKNTTTNDTTQDDEKITPIKSSLLSNGSSHGISNRPPLTTVLTNKRVVAAASDDDHIDDVDIVDGGGVSGVDVLSFDKYELGKLSANHVKETDDQLLEINLLRRKLQETETAMAKIIAQMGNVPTKGQVRHLN